MATWLTWLIAGGVIVVLGALVFLVFKYGKNATTKSTLTFVGGIAETVSKLLPDTPDKLDAHDILMVLGELSVEVAKWTDDPANKEWLDCKDDILKFIEDQRQLIPQLKYLPKDVLEKVAEALFTLGKAVPGIFSK